jgi:hypothetical protein
MKLKELLEGTNVRISRYNKEDSGYSAIVEVDGEKYLYGHMPDKVFRDFEKQVKFGMGFEALNKIKGYEIK